MLESPTIEVVRVGPSLSERIAGRRRAQTRALRRLREALERGCAPEPWAAVELPAGLLLADVCEALGLDAKQRGEVLGEAGAAFLENVQETTVKIASQEA